MGTPDFAVPCLQRILDDGHEVPAVFTQPDKPVGRHATLTPPPVKRLAQEHKIPVYQPTKMRDGTVAAQLRELAPDCLVVVAYGRILPQAILDVPPKGCINIHGSLLPKYRGAAPIQWSVINGEAVTGVTSMFMDAGMDTGPAGQRQSHHGADAGKSHGQAGLYPARRSAAQPYPRHEPVARLLLHGRRQNAEDP